MQLSGRMLLHVSQIMHSESHMGICLWLYIYMGSSFLSPYLIPSLSSFLPSFLRRNVNTESTKLKEAAEWY